MLKWAIVFLILGLIAGAFGFTTIAGVSIGIAKILFFIFATLFVLFLILGITITRKVTHR
jgi:uncharacterized membrane protein YtjA (UPF0391 family)